MQKQMQKQAIEQTSDGSDARARWFQVGVISATVLTPLVRRWQTLRAAEQARALWEAGRAGAARPFLRARHDETAPHDVNPRLWLAGAGVGLVAAGALAYYVVARRRLVADDEAAVELRLDAPAGPVRHLTDQVVHLRGRVRRPGRRG
jgi:hypothetical protein